jgi:hypothetical protein
MIISVINHTNGALPDSEVQLAVRAVNRQIAEDFFPYWGVGATLRLEGDSGLLAYEPSTQHPPDVRGEAVIYVWSPTNVTGALGYHDANFAGVPYSCVFPGVWRPSGQPWSVTLSHEALEMIVDPQVNLMVMGPHPRNPKLTVFHYYEVCDAVKMEVYEIDGVMVSNFLLPPYFTNTEEVGSRNDFLCRSYRGRTLKSFGVNPGGHIGFWNPVTRKAESFYLPGDAAAAKALYVREQLGLARRGNRYEYRASGGQPISAAIRRYLASARRSMANL